MKKLMIAAAAAALTGSTFAALPEAGDEINIETKVGVMHNVSITVKTLMPTVYDSTKTKGCPICTTQSGDLCYLFEQGTLKLNGIFAACDCDGTEFDPGADRELVVNGEIEGNLFTYGYFWLGSGKNTTVLFEKLTKPAAGKKYEFDSLPEVTEALGIDIAVARYSKTLKKAVVEIGMDGDDVGFDGVGFGSYTPATYKFNKNLGDDGQYVLKSLAKVSASGSVVGEIKVDTLAAYLKDQGKLSDEDAAESYKWFPVASGCTIGLDCTDGDAPTTVPLMGTFSIKGAKAKDLTKVIPAACWN